MKLDKWQKEVLETKGNLCICSPRQMGKSTVISQDAGEFACKNRNKTIMVISAVERQAYLLFEKILSYIYLNYKHMIKKGKDRPTKSKLKLSNGSIIHCLPTGDSGYGIRGFTIDRLYADEAAFIGEDVWAAVTPMLATTGGDIVLLSTPLGKNNYFYRMSQNPKFKFIHVDPHEVIKHREEPQKTNLIEFRKDEKQRMTKLQYQQEHLGLFVGGIQEFFPQELIKSCVREKIEAREGKKYCGVDVARMGADETAIITALKEGKKLKVIDLQITEKQTLTATARLLKHMDRIHNYSKIYIDTTGMGWGVFDPLKEDPQTKRKVIAIENIKKSIDREKGKKIDSRKRTMKEDLYNNLRNLMEKGLIEIPDNPEMIQSLRCIQYEYTDEGRVKIYGNYSHITEALIRAAWCMKDKSLNIYFYS
jgi:hypothetical protein